MRIQKFIVFFYNLIEKKLDKLIQQELNKIIKLNKKKMKGSVFLNPRFDSLGIRAQHIHRINPLIANDQKYLYFKGLGKNDTMKMIKWQDKVIINCTYLNNYKLILILCENYRLYVLTQNLDEITNMTGWQSKYNVAFQYLEQYSSLLMIGAETVEMLKIKIDTNVRMTKFLSSVKFSLKKLASQPLKAKDTLPWHKGYNINFQQNFFYVWSPEAISFLRLNNMEVLSQSYALTKKENPITYGLYNVYYKYTVIGTLNGQIRVWRLPMSQKFQHENVLVHTFYGHTKNITLIVCSRNNQKMILSSAEDLQLCFWNLETFELFRKFDLFGVYSGIYIKNMHEAFVIKDGNLGQLSLGQSLQFITEINSPVLMISKQIINEKVGSIALTLQQNLGMIMQADSILKGKDLNKIQTKNIYPPLKVKSIKQIISSPFVQNQFYLLAQNGELFKVIVPSFSKDSQGISSKIEQAYNIEMVQDRQKHPLHQHPQYIEFLNILPTEYDSEIREAQQGEKKSYRGEKNSDDQISLSRAVEKYQSLRLLMLGCNRGSVVFISTKDMKRIYCRLTYHRERVLLVQSIKQYKSSQFNPLNGYLASLCSQNYLKIIKFNHKKSTAQCILTYFTGQQLKIFRSFETYLVFLFYKGLFEITEIDVVGNTEEICCKRSTMIQNHEGQILSLDYEKNYQVILTSGSDNKIKIWTVNKILLFDVVLDDGLMFSSFISHVTQTKPVTKQMSLLQSKQIQVKQPHKISKSPEQKSTNDKLKQLRNLPRPIPVQFDLIIAHKNKLLLFNHIPLSFRPKQIDELNHNPQNLEDQKVSIRQVFQNFSKKHSARNIIKSNNKLSMSQLRQQIPKNPTKRENIKTEPSYKQMPGHFLSEKSLIDKDQLNHPSLPFKKSRTHTLQSLQYSKQSHFDVKSATKRLPAPLIYNKNKRTRTYLNNDLPFYSFKKSSREKASLITESSIQQTKKHLKDIADLRQEINMHRPILPLINCKKDDVFDQFMKRKLLGKNVLTRRDITLNRIIMKNIIRQHFQQDSKVPRMKVDN